MNELVGQKDVTLLELLDRILDKGVFLTGDVLISIADVDLIYLGVNLILSSVERMHEFQGWQP